MNRYNDILEDPSLRQNPFTLPDNYVLGLEERLHEHIKAEENPAPALTFWSKAKAPVMLAVTFGIIFGMGYGVLSLTGTADTGQNVQSATMAETLENWSLPSTFIEDYYDEMSYSTLIEHSLATVEMTDELESEIMNYITLNDIMDNYTEK